MLILTRRLGENLIIGDDVTISVLGIKGNQVRIGIDAPQNVSVHREEIYLKIQAEKAKALEDPAQLKLKLKQPIDKPHYRKPTITRAGIAAEVNGNH